MPLYRRKPTTVDAEQFTDPAHPPRGVKSCIDGGTGRILHYVVTMQGRDVYVSVGEWIVREAADPERFYPIADAEFQRIYEPAA